VAQEGLSMMLLTLKMKKKMGCDSWLLLKTGKYLQSEDRDLSYKELNYSNYENKEIYFSKNSFGSRNNE
jgi:hypothetical protein